MPSIRKTVAAALLAALALLLPSALAQGQAKTQGSPLSSAANYAYGCETGWLPGFAPPFDSQPTNIGATSCTILQSGTTIDETHLVPASGTVLSARVKSGPNPAPLQISTIRRYFKPNAQGQMEYTCCQGISQTPTFQPTPNAVTEVPVNLLVSTSQPENGQTGWWDIVAVSAEGPGTLPIADLGPHPTMAPASMPATYWHYPKVAPNDSNINQWTASNFEVLMNYSWCPRTAAASGLRAAAAQACPSAPPPVTPLPTPPGGGGTPTPPPATPTPTPTPPVTTRPGGGRTAPVTVAASALTLRRGAVRATIACTAARGARCRGTVRLRTRGGRSARLLSSAAIAIPGGRRAAVALRLSRRARGQLSGRRTPVRLEVDLGRAGRLTRDVVLVRG